MFYPVYWPRFVQKMLLPKAWCHYPSSAQSTLYLTFDDGPIPEVTPWVLEQLARYEAIATFFCVGANVERYPDLYQQLQEQGHEVGNHTQHHCDGWKTTTTNYHQEVTTAKRWIDSPLFRPPYGRLTPSQSCMLRQEGYQLVYWEVLSGDFDSSITWKQCLQNVLKHARADSIVVFHDSQKAWPHLKKVLPQVLEHYHQLGYQFVALPRPTT
ncbi:MAG: polysaccharide deacetylase family protein [Aureispira sp.]